MQLLDGHLKASMMSHGQRTESIELPQAAPEPEGAVSPAQPEEGVDVAEAG